MIGLDTNVVVRYLVQDDPAQAASASEAMDELTVGSPGFVGLVTLVEVFWVLRTSYGATRSVLLDTLRALLESPELVVEQAEVARRALRMAAAGADFADAVIVETARKAGCDRIVTFDRSAARHAGMTLLPADR